jgi:hypothetical protein
MLRPAVVISVKVVSLMDLSSGVQGILPLKGWSGMSLLIHARRAGGMKRKPSTVFEVSDIV